MLPSFVKGAEVVMEWSTRYDHQGSRDKNEGSQDGVMRRDTEMGDFAYFKIVVK